MGNSISIFDLEKAVLEDIHDDLLKNTWTELLIVISEYKPKRATELIMLIKQLETLNYNRGLMKKPRRV